MKTHCDSCAPEFACWNSDEPCRKPARNRPPKTDRRAKQHVTLEYALCVKYTKGELDVFPHSAYEIKLAGATLVKSPLQDEWEFLILDSNDQVIGEGETPNAAIADAQYFLMNESRNKLMIPHAPDCACRACAMIG